MADIRQGPGPAQKADAWAWYQAIHGLWARYAAVLDAGDLEGWVALFTEDATYKVMTKDNYDKGYYVGLMDDTKARMRDRVSVLRQYYHLEPVTYRHLWTPISLELQADEAVAATVHFAVFTTRQGCLPELLAVGRYFDLLRYVANAWQFQRRLVVLDNEMVTEMPYPL